MRMIPLSRQLVLLLAALCACGDEQSDDSPTAPELDPDAPPEVRRTIAALRRSLAERRCQLLYFKALMLKAKTGELPTTLDELVGAENPSELPLSATEREGGEPTGKDPWDSPFKYERHVVIKVSYDAPPKTDVRLTSPGPDRVLDTDDDISYPRPDDARSR